MKQSKARTVWRCLLALFYFGAGVAHLIWPSPFLTITPAFIPLPNFVVQITGVAEIAGALALMQPVSVNLRRAAGIGLALYALCVWPANFNHMMIDLVDGNGSLPLAYHLPRLALQPVIIWLALWTGGATEWPFRRSVR